MILLVSRNQVLSFKTALLVKTKLYKPVVLRVWSSEFFLVVCRATRPDTEWPGAWEESPKVSPYCEVVHRRTTENSCWRTVVHKGRFKS